jgi:hypothetical protein
MIDPNNTDLVHHLALFECDTAAKFDDNNLPNGICDEYYQESASCYAGMATTWAVGGDLVRHVLFQTRFQFKVYPW